MVQLTFSSLASLSLTVSRSQTLNSRSRTFSLSVWRWLSDSWKYKTQDDYKLLFFLFFCIISIYVTMPECVGLHNMNMCHTLSKGCHTLLISKVNWILNNFNDDEEVPDQNTTLEKLIKHYLELWSEIPDLLLQACNLLILTRRSHLLRLISGGNILCLVCGSDCPLGGFKILGNEYEEKKTLSGPF